MAYCYPCSGLKLLFTSSVLICMLGWFSVLRTLHTSPNFNCSNPNQKQHRLQEWKDESRALHNTPMLTASIKDEKPHKRRLRVLMGIFTIDRKMQLPYRRQYRFLFNVFPQYNDTRVCSLYEFENFPDDERRYECQFIYTFVVGGLKRQGARTELVDDSDPILMTNLDFVVADDIKPGKATDVTFLNIRENMNEGKSQTWFKFASTIMEKYDLDYAGKLDSDSLIYLDKFFSYAYNNLPPPPYNSGIITGVPIDKLWWKKPNEAIATDSAERHFKKAYGRVMHIYAAGQCYILSRDMAETVVLEAPNSESYKEGHEDHDISAMAFHSKKPISFHFLSLQQQFWKHPLKRYRKKVRKWRTRWHNEILRMNKVLELRQEQLKKEAAEEAETTPELLAAPVELELEDNEGEEEEEEEDEDEIAMQKEAEAAGQ